jgi:signal transduction histidine kinase
MLTSGGLVPVKGAGLESLHISLRDLSYTSMVVFALALASVVYLVRLRSRFAAAKWLAGAFASFTLAALGLFVTSSVVFTGYALWPLPYTAGLIGLAALAQFAYQFPENDQPRKAYLSRLASAAAILPAMGFTAFTAQRVYTGPPFRTGLEELFPLVLPLGTLTVIVIFLQRAAHVASVSDTGGAAPTQGRLAMLLSVVAPPNRQALALRDFSIGLIFVLVAGLAYPLTDAGALSCAVAVLLLSVGLLIGLAWILLVYFSHGSEATSFIAKLIVISLVVSLAAFSAVGLWVTLLWDADYARAKELESRLVGQLLQADDLDGMPDAVAYVAACSDSGTGGCFARGVHPIYVAGELTGKADALDFLMVEDGLQQVDTTALWPFANADTYKLIENQAWIGQPIVLRYADHPIGSVFKYIGLEVTVAGVQYEIGFPLAEYRQLVHARTLVLLLLVLTSSATILVVFPLFLRTNLVRPLQALLEGVRQVNAGNLDVAVPMQMGDEIGFLAYSFTGMVGSLRTLNANLRQEIGERRRAEEEIRTLYATLEQRVAEQTRDLTALFNVSAAAGQALNLETLMQRSVGLTMAAIQSTAGLIYLRDEVLGRPDSAWLQIMAHRGVPKRLLGRIARLPACQELVGWVLEHKEPLLVPDLSRDPRTPEPLRFRAVRGAVLAPLRAGGQVMGVFCLLRRHNQPFDQDEVALLASIADQVGLAVEGFQLRQVAEQSAVLRERQRLSRDLHDSITQYLYSLNLLAEAGQAQLETGAVSAVNNTFAQIGRTARQALKEIRLFIQQLRPPALEQEGLVGALHQRLASVEGRANVQTRLLVDEAIVLPARVEDALYHIASEALNNTLKHADADTVTVHLRLEGDQAVLSVLDNGRGFDRTSLDGSGMGLESMNERAKQIGGSVDIVSTLGTGTLVRITAPLVPTGAGG